MRNPRDIILSPVVSEKSYDLIEDLNTYTFEIDPRANKTEVNIETAVPVTDNTFVLISPQANLGDKGLWYTIPEGSGQIVVDLENSRGLRLKDKSDGKEYLDFFQFFASMPLGFNHPKCRKINRGRNLHKRGPASGKG